MFTSNGVLKTKEQGWGLITTVAGRIYTRFLLESTGKPEAGISNSFSRKYTCKSNPK